MNRDSAKVPELTDRQLKILAALIQTYIHQPEPVSSKQLVEAAELGVSSATVRNELAVLEQLGMIRAPHTSAGRIPTEAGYRYFVQNLLQNQSLTRKEQQDIRTELQQVPPDIQKWVRTAAAVLARQTHSAALVAEPRSRAIRFKHLQLIHTQGRLVLMILVLEGGEVLQQMLTLAEPTEQERLAQISFSINSTFNGDTAQNIREKSRISSDVLEQEVLELVAEVLEDSAQNQEFSIYGYGFSDILPEFSGGVGAQQAMRMLEGGTVISRMLNEMIESPTEDPVRVLVGGDGRYDEFSHLGIVVGRYGTEKLVGAISVLGPTRMRYGRAISTVRYVATLMSNLMRNMYDSKDEA